MTTLATDVMAEVPIADRLEMTDAMLKWHVANCGKATNSRCPHLDDLLDMRLDLVKRRNGGWTRRTPDGAKES